MGAINFSLDVQLADMLKNKLDFNSFVETGTFRGDSVDAVKANFKNIYTIELSPEYCHQAVSKFESQEHIHVLHGDSSHVLEKVAADLRDISTLYFLDAHWCIAENTAAEFSQCPLLAELEAINHLNENSVIIIDDARLFLAPPLAPHEISQWPEFHDLIQCLHTLSDVHRIIVLNDNIIIYPKKIQKMMVQYAQKHGVDWLNISHNNRDYENLRLQFNSLLSQLQDKEDKINELSVDLSLKKEKVTYLQKYQKEKLAHCIDELIAKEAVIKQQSMALKACAEPSVLYKIQHRFMGCVFSIKLKNLFFRIKALMRPKLGMLYQHSPKRMQLPSDYQQKSNLNTWPKISIVTPSFSQGHFIERTIKSVIDQAYPNLEYFIQDGGSKDSTVDVIEKYTAQLSGWKSEADSGQSQAINRGMLQTSGEIMAWLNSDDLFLPGSLAYVADYFSTHPEVDVVYGHRLLIDDQDMEVGKWMMPEHDDEVLSWADYIPQETMFWRRSIWEKSGGRIDEEFRFAMDWDLILRMRDAGATFVRLPRFIGAFRVHPDQKSSANIHDVGMQEMDILRKRVLGRIPSRAEIHRSLYLYLIKHVFSHFMYSVKNKLRSVSCKLFNAS